MATRRRGLDSVLRLKQREEERKTLELATISEEERHSREALRLLREKHHAQLRQIAEAAAGAVDPMRLQDARTYLHALDGFIDDQLMHLTAVEQRVLESKDQLIEVLKERRSLELLEERHVADERAENGRRERNQNDEMNTQRYARRLAGGGR